VSLFIKKKDTTLSSQSAEVIVSELPISKAQPSTLSVYVRLLAFTDSVELVPLKSTKKSFCVIDALDNYLVLQFTQGKPLRNNITGKNSTIICDFCMTLQSGAQARRTTFSLLKSKSRRSVSFLTCDNLLCSAHTRGMTPASMLSRKTLYESLSDTERINRLEANLHRKLVRWAKEHLEQT
jgi:hypothetical protein